VSDLRPSVRMLLARGLKRRCPMCGRGRAFEGFYRMRDRCPQCGYAFEREEGYWVGAVIMNFVFVEAWFALLFVTIVVCDGAGHPVGSAADRCHRDERHPARHPVPVLKNTLDGARSSFPSPPNGGVTYRLCLLGRKMRLSHKPEIRRVSETRALFQACDLRVCKLLDFEQQPQITTEKAKTGL
jgi:hypothetical protein